MKNLPKISVIFPVLNSQKLLPTFFESLNNQSYPKSKIEIIIIDNGSEDKTAEFITKNYPQVKLIKLRKNIGFAPALNLGLKKARGQAIFVTNDDVTFNKDCLLELISLLFSEKNIAMVSGRLLYKDKKTRAWPGFRLNPYLGYQPFDTKMDQIRESDWFSGPAMLLKNEILKKVGNFDAEYFFCGEDFDISLIFKKLGYKILYTPRAEIYHGFRRTGIKQKNFSSLFAHYRGKFRLVFKHSNLSQIIFFLFIQIFLTPIHRLIFTGWDNTRLFLKAQYSGLFYNLIRLPEILKSREKMNKLISKNKVWTS